MYYKPSNFIELLDFRNKSDEKNIYIIDLYPDYNL